MELPGKDTHYSCFGRTITLICTLILFTACQQQEPEDTVPVPSDQEITTTIRTQFVQAPDVPHEEIKVSVQDGIATLSGTVDNLLAKKQATNIAQSVYGVLSVINNTRVTANRPDEAVQEDVIQALSENPVTEAWEVSVNVNNGLVYLKGLVESWQERQFVERVAQGVKGVKSINNTIIVSNHESRPDKELQTEVQRTLMMDNRIGADRVKVDVEDGRVVLTGSVGSAYERKLALNRAHVAGVDSIVVDELEVDPEYHNLLLRADELSTLTSDEVREAIESSLTYDPRVPESQVEVTVDDGTVTLTGSVENLSSKIAAEEDALHTAGVNTVNNNIEVEHKVVVRPEVPTSDKAIKSRIRGAIVRDPYIEHAATDIKLIVEEGIVALEGKVDSEFEKNQIEEVTSNVKGVIAINNNLDISGESNS